jgi:hypothetical protein
MEQDERNIKLLSIFHYVLGGLLFLFSCFPFIHVVMGVLMVSGAFDGQSSGEAPPAFVGWMFIVIGSLFILFGWSLSVCVIVAGRKLSKLRSRLYCLVIAGIECMFMPFGTVLGVFTIVVLMKDSVKELFAQAAALQAGQGVSN